MVQGLRLWVPIAGGTSSIPGQGSSTCLAVQPKKKKKRERRRKLEKRGLRVRGLEWRGGRGTRYPNSRSPAMVRLGPSDLSLGGSLGEIASWVAWHRPLGPTDKLIQALAEEGKQAEEGDRQKVEKGQSWWSRGGACEQEGAQGPRASSAQKSLMDCSH